MTPPGRNSARTKVNPKALASLSVVPPAPMVENFGDYISRLRSEKRFTQDEVVTWVNHAHATGTFVTIDLLEKHGVIKPTATPSGKGSAGYLCPRCGSVNSAALKFTAGMFECLYCGAGGDMLDLVALSIGDTYDAAVQWGMKRLQKQEVSKLGSDKAILSKSTLSLYERNDIKMPRPEILKLFARRYEVPYEQIVHRWVTERFYGGTFNFIQGVSREGFTISTSAPERPVQVITLDHLRYLQSMIAPDGEVWVVAAHFLDNDLFFDMVVRNLRKGVRYTYLMDDRRQYDGFIRRVADFAPDLKHHLDDKRTFFVELEQSDFPINYVVHVDHQGNPKEPIRSFIGVLRETKPWYYQVASSEITLRHYDRVRRLVIHKDGPQARNRRESDTR